LKQSLFVNTILINDRYMDKSNKLGCVKISYNVDKNCMVIETCQKQKQLY